MAKPSEETTRFLAFLDQELAAGRSITGRMREFRESFHLNDRWMRMLIARKLEEREALAPQAQPKDGQEITTTTTASPRLIAHLYSDRRQRTTVVVVDCPRGQESVAERVALTALKRHLGSPERRESSKPSAPGGRRWFSLLGASMLASVFVAVLVYEAATNLILGISSGVAWAGASLAISRLKHRSSRTVSTQGAEPTLDLSMGGEKA